VTERLTFLDGPMGSELEARGVALPAPLWTAAGVASAPEAVRAIHREYADAGAEVHTTATFRTTARSLAGSAWAARWEELARRAVTLAREGAGPGATIAGSMAPLEDCYSPQLTPDDEALAAEHAALARCLAEAPVDLLLVETMPTPRELAAATRAAVATGLTTWCAVTLGPRGNFFDAAGVAEAAALAADAGAEAFLLNCSPAGAITPLLERLAATDRRPARLGAYGNAIFAGETEWSPERYADEARRWVAAGATILGGCCGTTPHHLRALRRALG